MSVAAFSHPAVLFSMAMVSNVVALGLLPKTVGFTNFSFSAVCVFLFIFTMWALSRILHQGVDVGILIPIMSAVLPLLTVFVGVFFYQESVSVVKVLSLLVACGLIGVAAKFS